MKKLVVLILPLVFLVGCTNEVEENKYAYLEYKSELEEQENFSSEEDINFNVYFNIIRENEEIVNYSVIIDHLSINMYDVKALLIHDYTYDEAFPSIGILGNPVDLLKDTDSKIELKGQIQTIDDISNVQFKLYLEYKDDNGLENKIYYQLSRG